MLNRRLLIVAASCTALLCLTGCTAGPRHLLVDVTSTEHVDDESDSSRKATPCEFSGRSSFLAGRPIATLLDGDGKKLGQVRPSQPYVGVGGFCETFIEYPSVDSEARYRVVVGGRSVTLETNDGQPITGSPGVLDWDVFASDFR